MLIKKGLLGWLISRLLDFAVCFLLVIAGHIIDSRLEKIYEFQNNFVFAGVLYLFINLVGGFFITSLLWWLFCTWRQWSHIKLAIGSVIIAFLTVSAIHFYHAGWSNFQIESLVVPFILIALMLHGLITYLVAAFVAKSRGGQGEWDE